MSGRVSLPVSLCEWAESQMPDGVVLEWCAGEEINPRFWRNPYLHAFGEDGGEVLTVIDDPMDADTAWLVVAGFMEAVRRRWSA